MHCYVHVRILLIPRGLYRDLTKHKVTTFSFIDTINVVLHIALSTRWCVFVHLAEYD